MFAKRLLQKAMPQHNLHQGNMTPADFNLQVPVHYGIPYTASIMAFDPIQCILAIGTLDGRIKIIGGNSIEGLFISPKRLPYKFMEFLCNQGFLVGVSNENDIQVWDLENRCLTCSLQWESNITAFSVIQGTYLMYSGDENGLTSVLKFDAEDGKILLLPYHIPAKAVKEAASVSYSNHTSVVGILPQPCTSGNRVLIAYEDGLMILWDISKNCVISVRGHAHLHLKDANSLSRVENEPQDLADGEQEEKEICSLCWASTTGSILAVGYIDGDILLWNLSLYTNLEGQQAEVSSNNVVKLQLSSEGRRLPVIVLHWSADSKSDNDRRGKLFVYGGDEIGSEEVLTVLSLDYSSGVETIKCVARVDISLHGSYADMILIPRTRGMENTATVAVFILTNPGQIHVYDISSLSESRHQDTKPSIPANKFPMMIPTTDPCMTVSKLCLLPVEGDSCRMLLKKASGKEKDAMRTMFMGMKWPLTGGVPSELSFAKDFRFGRIYIAGYQDGSVRIWDATHPTFTLIHVIEGKVNDMEFSGGISSISALDFSSTSSSLAVGSESGLIQLYKLCGTGTTDSQTFHFITEAKCEVHTMPHENDFHCTAVFSVSSSAVRTLQFAKSGAKLAVGFQCGQVTMLDTNSMSILFHVDCLSLSSSPIISLDMRVVPHLNAQPSSPKHTSPRSPSDLTDALFVLARSAHVIVVDSISGNIVTPGLVHTKKESTAIAMYVIDGNTLVEMTGQKHSQEAVVQSEAGESKYPSGSAEQAVELPSSSDALDSGEVSPDSVLLLCCEDALRLYPLKSVIRGDNTSVHKVNLPKPCCWSTIIKRKDEKACCVLLLYQTGVLEIRSLPDLEVIEESSLMSILRWNFKASMDKTMSSSDNGHIALVNGSELAFISTLAGINDFRIPESLASLHDKVLAAAADAATRFSMFQKKKQGPSPGIISGLIKGLKGGKAEHSVDTSESTRYNFMQQLEGYFSKDPFSNTSTTFSHDKEVELSIDDIIIDEDVPTASSSHVYKHDRKVVEDMEREKLFQGAKGDAKPRKRTPEEILTQYKFAGDASAAAAYARDKLAQRQEKLEKIRERTEELKSGAENFASMANELVRTMEAKKWWKL